ncbi:hypothetical protein JTE90_000763 [Oedothorax gibbosus]|uniref:Cysteine protease n=1 Tax=Oedothorax gibbosus TaxID=931172 RepID=A0AAV6UMY8_9ARAC|nr:hypothetical protein JTE90_000763 [Oedothorax gibbosus]
MMEEIYACIAYEPCLLDYIDFKKVTGPLWILGKQYNVHSGNDLEDVNADIRSRLWFTYRKLFQPIGTTYLTSDSGWGCMHRCGQMLLAQAFILRHFGREWKWKPDCTEEMYKKILSKFDDRAECPYSIHKIASMGSMLEKQVGQWFGPNTVVQVLRRLSEEDTENDINLHVAMDNMVIKSEIRQLFRKKAKECTEGAANQSNLSSPETEDEVSENGEESHPVLLTIPLRLGLSEIIPVYFDKLKNVFKLKQCVGIIGGRTNHASYFIGYVGNELIYLDPHTTQPHKSEGPMDDLTYHCDHPSRMDFSQLDPSIALCFYLESEIDFEEWCKEAQKALLEPEKDAVFEILEEKPAMLSYVDIDECDDYGMPSLDAVDRIYTSDDEFELLM